MKILERFGIGRNHRTENVARKAFLTSSFLQTEIDAELRQSIAQTGNSIVTAAIGWLWRQMSSVRGTIYQDDIMRPQHPASTLITQLWHTYSYAIIDSLIRDGNAYILKSRATTSASVQNLTYIPASIIQFERNREHRIIGYRIKRAFGEDIYDLNDMIHLRWLIDKDDPQLGISPLRAVSDLIHADNQAVISSDAILSNLGIIGIVIAPEEGSWGFDEESKRALKREFEANYTGRKRGSFAFFNQRVRLDTVHVNLSQFNMEWITSLTEERICAVLGINPIVLYLGSGLNQSTYNNVVQAREEAWEGLVIPLLESIAQQLRFQFLRSYDNSLEWRWDWSHAPSMLDVSLRQAEIFDRAFKAGVITVAEYRAKLGLASSETDDVYLRDPRMIELQPGTAQWELENEQ